MHQRYTDVQFKFVSLSGDPYSCRGAVIVEDTEMVLEVEWHDGPYLVFGKVADGFFSGRHHGLPYDVPVDAKWIRLDDIYIGTWLEEDTLYLFTFRLPSDLAAGM